MKDELLSECIPCNLAVASSMIVEVCKDSKKNKCEKLRNDYLEGKIPLGTLLEEIKDSETVDSKNIRAFIEENFSEMLDKKFPSEPLSKRE